jgi:superfamily I DNA/RNA helicase
MGSGSNENHARFHSLVHWIQDPFPPGTLVPTLPDKVNLDKLNPEQRAAVETTEGPLLILAGAGSGKTRVITSRIAWLVREKGVAPDSILAVTFTNKAAKEMGERVERLMGHSSLAKPLIATFHSLCVRMLRRDIEALKVGNVGLTRSFAIYDESDQQGIVKQVMRRMGIDTKQLTPRQVLGRIRSITWPRRIPTANASHTSSRATRPSWPRTTRSTSTICCWKRCGC